MTKSPRTKQTQDASDLLVADLHGVIEEHVNRWHAAGRTDHKAKAMIAITQLMGHWLGLSAWGEDDPEGTIVAGMEIFNRHVPEQARLTLSVMEGTEGQVGHA